MALAGQSLEHRPQLMHRPMSNTCFPRKPSGTSHLTKGYLLVAGFLNRYESTFFTIGGTVDFFFIAYTSIGYTQMPSVTVRANATTESGNMIFQLAETTWSMRNRAKRVVKNSEITTTASSFKTNQSVYQN